MKKKTRGTPAIALALSLVLAGCCAPPNPKPVTEEDVDFTSYIIDYSVLIRNNTGERLVAFKGELKAETLIGGIPAHARDHGLKNDPRLFDKTEGFPLILLTEEQYYANKYILNSQMYSPFTRIFVFYNKFADNTEVYEISDRLGGPNSLVIVNATMNNVELRVNGADEVLGYFPAGMYNTRLKLQDGYYDIFPVIKRYNQFYDIVETVYPIENGSNSVWFQAFALDEENTSATINIDSVFQNTSAFTRGAALVSVNNQSSGDISFMKGYSYFITTTGVRYITRGNSGIFRIDMLFQTGVPGYQFADSIEAINWRFGSPAFEVTLQTSETDATPVTSLIIERDKMYTVTVSGDYSDNTLKAWVSDIIDIPINE